MSKAWTAFTFALLLVACSGGADGGKPSDESVIAAWVEQLRADSKAHEERYSKSLDKLVVGPVSRDGLTITIPYSRTDRYKNRCAGSIVLTVTDVQIIAVPESSMQPYRATITANEKDLQPENCYSDVWFAEVRFSSWNAESKTWGNFRKGG